MTALAVASVAGGRSEAHVLGMAELDWTGLSEQWLLRRLGDVHWRLVADALGQRDALFRSADGAPAYAAFCAISISLRRLGTVRLAAVLEVRSRLGRLSATRLLSRHRLVVGNEEIGLVTMVSAFVIRDGSGRNRALRRAIPQGLMAPLPAEDDPFAHAASAIARGQAHEHLGLDLGEEPAGSVRLRPVPQDFNAVGLLYCATYPALADRARWALDLNSPRSSRRDLIYMGNVERGEAVTVRCGQSCSEADGHASWTRIERDDGAPLCLVVDASLSTPIRPLAIQPSCGLSCRASTTPWALTALPPSLA